MSALIESSPRIALAAATRPEQGQYLSFMLGGEIYAIGILNVKEIIEFGEITTVPMVPHFIRGVINLRGRVVPVIDLSVRFGRGVSEVMRRTCIVIVEVGVEGEVETQDIGIMVDAVNEVIEIAAADIEPPPAFGAGIRPDFISGMARRAERFLILLAMDRVLSVDEMVGLSQLETASHSMSTQLTTDQGFVGEQALN